MEKMQEYLDSMDASSSEDEGEEEEEEAEVATQMQHVGMGSPSLNQEVRVFDTFTPAHLN